MGRSLDSLATRSRPAIPLGYAPDEPGNLRWTTSAVAGSTGATAPTGQGGLDEQRHRRQHRKRGGNFGAAEAQRDGSRPSRSPFPMSIGESLLRETRMARGRGLRPRRGLPGRPVPPSGSGCSIAFGASSARPGSAERLRLAVYDIMAAREDLIRRGVEVSDLFHSTPARNPSLGPTRKVAPQHLRDIQGSDGNGWLLQEIKERLPGRLDWRRQKGLTDMDVETLRGAPARGGGAPRSLRGERSEAPLVGLLRRLHRRA